MKKNLFKIIVPLAALALVLFAAFAVHGNVKADYQPSCTSFKDMGGVTSYFCPTWQGGTNIVLEPDAQGNYYCYGTYVVDAANNGVFIYADKGIENYVNFTLGTSYVWIGDAPFGAGYWFQILSIAAGI